MSTGDPYNFGYPWGGIVGQGVATGTVTTTSIPTGQYQTTTPVNNGIGTLIGGGGGYYTTTADSSWPTHHPGLRTVLGSEVGNFAVVPSSLEVGFGDDKQKIVDLLRALKNVPFIELAGEVAFAPMVYDAIVMYVKTTDGFADMKIVDFISSVLARK